LSEKETKGRILIMDDEDMIGEIACQMLIHLGYDGHHVKDGETAIEEYSRCMGDGTPYDIVIMDLSIPGGMGGKEAIGKMLEIDPEAKVLVSSGNPADQIMMQFGDYGFKGAINKPFDLASLQSKLASLL
jgi:CheY-like chemotaxis protein